MLRIGIICPSAIAFNRFLPALKKINQIQYVGVACARASEWFGHAAQDGRDAVIESEREKAEKFSKYGGEVFDGYESMLSSGKIDAVYLPLPPALHYQWAQKALDNGLHVLLEKPSTTSLTDTAALVRKAKEKKLALYENYMFMHHAQIKAIRDVIESGQIGDVRLYRIDFGFPNRGSGDFRYVMALGGGALLDCGGYTLKYADFLLGGNAEIATAQLQYADGVDVDIAGSATLNGLNGQTAQISFGMDNDYRCSIDVWGSSGTLKSGRVLTAPDGYVPSYDIYKNGVVSHVEMKADDAFANSVSRFLTCVQDEGVRLKTYEELLRQETLVEQFKQKLFRSGEKSS